VTVHIAIERLNYSVCILTGASSAYNCIILKPRFS